MRVIKSVVFICEIIDRYCAAMNFLVDQYGGQAHWAKIELPSKKVSSAINKDVIMDGAESYLNELNVLRSRLSRKFPIESYNEYRAVLDPTNVLSNHIVDELFNPNLFNDANNLN